MSQKVGSSLPPIRTREGEATFIMGKVFGSCLLARGRVSAAVVFVDSRPQISGHSYSSSYTDDCTQEQPRMTPAPEAVKLLPLFPSDWRSSSVRAFVARQRSSIGFRIHFCVLAVSVCVCVCIVVCVQYMCVCGFRRQSSMTTESEERGNNFLSSRNSRRRRLELLKKLLAQERERRNPSRSQFDTFCMAPLFPYLLSLSFSFKTCQNQDKFFLSLWPAVQDQVGLFLSPKMRTKLSPCVCL